MKEDEKKQRVHFIDLEEFGKADENDRREMVRELLRAIGRKGGEGVDED